MRSTQLFRVAFFMLVASASSTVTAMSVVVPNNYSQIEGDGSNIVPFSDTTQSWRYQQVYAASEFAAVKAGGGIITAISFRFNADHSSPFAMRVPSLQINFSTTSKAPYALDDTFVNNVGPDTVVAFGPSEIILGSADMGPRDGPREFDMTIPLTTPFLYEPAIGNLLMEVRSVVEFRGEIGHAIDAVTFDPSTSRIYAHENADAVTANGVGPEVGLVTQFTFVPEPSTATLLIISLIAIRRRHSL